ncbi:MAG: hypothetical protein J6X24_02555 [Firmicutes bacterium]|nr:hypothetical protein [Bacillota bacterium]
MFKKMIAPVVVVTLVIAYYIGIAVFLIRTPDVPAFTKIVLACVAAGLTGVGIYVLRQRAKEIQSGEEDDLDKY